MLLPQLGKLLLLLLLLLGPQPGQPVLYLGVGQPVPALDVSVQRGLPVAPGVGCPLLPGSMGEYSSKKSLLNWDFVSPIVLYTLEKPVSVNFSVP